MIGPRQNFRLIGPMGEIRLIKTGETSVCPGGNMHAIGNSVDMVAVKNVVGSLRVAFRNAIDIAAEVERELRHVETILLAKQSEFLDLDVVFAQDALDQCIRKPVEKPPRPACGS